MKKILVLAIFLAMFPLFGQAQEEQQQFSVCLDLVGDGAFAKGGPAFSPGAGGSLFGDWRPLPYLSIGTGFDFTLHSDFGSWQTASWDLGGRIFPLGTGKGGEGYLQGTLGLNLATYGLEHTWPGNFHGTLGPGYRVFLDPGNAFDLGAQYDFFSPRSKPLQAVGVKVGWTWLFGAVPN